MNKDKLILGNGLEVNIESLSSLSNIKVLFDTKYDMISMWDMMTEENLKSVQMQNSDGLIVGTYENLILDSETSTVQKDGKILTSFHLRQKTEIELLSEEVRSLKEGQEILEGVALDTGEAISRLAEVGGLV